MYHWKNIIKNTKVGVLEEQKNYRIKKSRHKFQMKEIDLERQKKNLQTFLKKNFDFLQVRKNKQLTKILNNEIDEACFSDMILFIDDVGSTCTTQEFAIVITKETVYFINMMTMDKFQIAIKDIHKLTMFPKFELILCIHYKNKELIMETFRKRSIFRFLVNINKYYYNSKNLQQTFENYFESSPKRKNLLKNGYKPSPIHFY